MNKTIVNATSDLVHAMNVTNLRPLSDGSDLSISDPNEITPENEPWSYEVIAILVLLALLCLVSGYHLRYQLEGRRTMDELPKMMAVADNSNSTSRRLKNPDNEKCHKRTETPNPQGSTSSTVDSFDSEDLYQPQIVIRLSTLQEGPSVSTVQTGGTTQSIDRMIDVHGYED